MKIDTKKLLKNFIVIKNIANIGILVCYKRLFSLVVIIKYWMINNNIYYYFSFYIYNSII